MSQFYFVFPTYEEAKAALPQFNSDESQRMREQAAEWRRREQESFDRCDTDGCVTQWCNAISARDADRSAELADNGNLAVFKVLVDSSTGEVVGNTIHIFQSRFHHGNEYKWAVRRAGDDKTQWVTDYKRESGFAAKGLTVAWMLAPAKLYSRHPGNHLPEQRGLSGLASYHGKTVGIDYETAGLRP
jgi:hypothetical protein